MNFYTRKRRMPQVIIVSLIDIFAILLIFVIVTTTFKTAQPEVTIKLPESKTASTAERAQEPVVLSISESEEIFLGSEKIALDDLKQALQELLKPAAGAAARAECRQKGAVRRRDSCARCLERRGRKRESLRLYGNDPMILEIVKYGDPCCARKARRSSRSTKRCGSSPKICSKRWMRQRRGLAAQQVGVPVQLTVIDVADVEDRPSTTARERR
jgi:biopolymer transport protein ExbD